MTDVTCGFALLKSCLIVTGLQKSGTSLLKRLLMLHPDLHAIVPGEGKDFWGDDPPFSPQRSPCGDIYQKHDGAHGHHATAKDATAQAAALLHNRLETLDDRSGRVPLFKNPYHTVRIGWLREVMPKAKVIAIFRSPWANVYSLSKKFVAHAGRGRPPESGWWGVKPAHWMDLRRPDLHQQLALQWAATNRHLLGEDSKPDLMFEYSKLCQSPHACMQAITEMFDLPNVSSDRLPEIQSLDDEHLRGGPLLSQNRHWARTGSLRTETQMQSDQRIERLTEAQMATINAHCESVYSALQAQANV